MLNRIRWKLHFKIYRISCIVIILIIYFNAAPLSGQSPSRSFELRYYTPDPKANGETDFKGETEFLNTEQRVTFLKQYAGYARRFFNDPKLNTEVVKNEEVKAAMNKIKPQPLPIVRRRIPLEEWKSIGYKKGQHEERERAVAVWADTKITQLKNKNLFVTAKRAELTWSFPSQSWRFSFSWRARVARSDQRVAFEFSDKQQVIATTTGFDSNGRFFYYTANDEKKEALAFTAGNWYDFKVEFDLAAFKRGEDVVRYNLYINDELVADYVPLQRVIIEGVGYAKNFTSISYVNTFAVKAAEGTEIDNILGIGYHLTGRETYPYTVETFLDENFETKPDIQGWQELSYNDQAWQNDILPIAHGSERYAGEDLYLRKKIFVNDYTRAILNIETLDPGGEIWINGKVAEVIPNRHPVHLDISKYLIKNDTNLVAIKVNHFYLTKEVGEVMPHSSLDFNIGWFAGRMSLDLTGKSTVEDVFVYAEDVSAGTARVRARIQVNHRGYLSFRGSAVINVYPWLPSEAATPAATINFPVVIGHGMQEFTQTITIPNPNLWTSEHPNLYKIEVILKDESGKAIDDYVLTTGIRTLSQLGGTFRVNGKPAMLNGAQIMGFRSPIEKMIEWQRCPPAEWLAKEILMIKKMNGNMMRVHVHAWENGEGENINDPRLAEMADQMGLMLIWATPAWIRTGWGWGQIEFEGLPKYMRQVYNHPSIVMWEAANHTQSFKQRDVQESNLFCEKVYNTIFPIDASRIISFNSSLAGMHYGNDEGTIDDKGNKITPSPAWTAPMVTRGNQDGIVGYSSDWSHLRTWPDDYRKSFLNSKERAYFNFEHEESIGQDNWNLVKGKPWYKLHSYEWDYDIGTIGRRLTLDEWQESQAWQAFSAWESMKKQRILDYDGFSWCNLHGGPNSVTYKKPLIDFLGYAKLVYWTNKMVLQPVVAGSGNVDIVYGPQDEIIPTVISLGDARTVTVMLLAKRLDGTQVFSKVFGNVQLPTGRTVTKLPGFKPLFPAEGYYVMEYEVK